MMSKPSPYRSLPRSLAAGTLLLCLALWGCDGGDVTGTLGTSGAKKTPAPAPTELGGAVQKTDATPTPSPTPTPIPTPTPTATPTPEPLPTPRAMGIEVSIAATSINLSPIGGGASLYPYTTTATGTVMLSNALKSSDIDWSSSDTAIATVASDGTVTAGSTTGGLVQIIGTSKDGLVSQAVDLTVTTFGGAEVVVD